MGCLLRIISPKTAGQGPTLLFRQPFQLHSSPSNYMERLSKVSMQQQGDTSEMTLVDLLYENSISQTRAGWIIPTVSGSLSFLSSALIIYIIARSQRTIYAATYHRIMVCICLSDMLSSLAILLTTLPMPKDVNEVYNFDGNSYGTVRTCEIQASSYGIGSGISCYASICLSLYYVLTIRYHVTHRVVSRYVEPLGLMTCLISMGIWNYLNVKTLDNLNPVPFLSWCTVGDYPYGCYQEDGDACIRGQAKDVSIWTSGMIVVLIGAAIQFICMALIISSVYNGEKESLHIAQVEMEAGDEETTREDVEMVAKYREIQRLKMRRTKIVALQAFLYFASFAVTYSFVPQLTSKSQSAVLQVATLILKPLQGFFNAMIFIYHKVYLLRHRDNLCKISLRDAITAVLRYPGETPGILLEMPEDSNLALQLYNAQVDRMLQQRDQCNAALQRQGHEASSESRNNEWSVCGEEREASLVSSRVDSCPAPYADTLNPHSKNKVTHRVDKNHTLSIGANDDSLLSFAETLKIDNSRGAMYEETSRLSYAEIESAADSRFERMSHVRQSSRNTKMVERDDGSSNLSRGNEWSFGGAESFTDDSADLRYAKMKKMIEARSRASNAMSNGKRQRPWLTRGSKE